MGVGAENRVGPAVYIVAEGLFFGGGFGVEIHNGEPAAGVIELVEPDKGVVQGLHKGHTRQVDHLHPGPAQVQLAAAGAGGQTGVVGGAEQKFLLLKGLGFGAVETVVAGGDDVGLLDNNYVHQNHSNHHRDPVAEPYLHICFH